MKIHRAHLVNLLLSMGSTSIEGFTNDELLEELATRPRTKLSNESQQMLLDKLIKSIEDKESIDIIGEASPALPPPVSSSVPPAPVPATPVPTTPKAEDKKGSDPTKDAATAASKSPSSKSDTNATEVKKNDTKSVAGNGVGMGVKPGSGKGKPGEDKTVPTKQLRGGTETSGSITQKVRKEKAPKETKAVLDKPAEKKAEAVSQSPAAPTKPPVSKPKPKSPPPDKGKPNGPSSPKKPSGKAETRSTATNHKGHTKPKLRSAKSDGRPAKVDKGGPSRTRSKPKEKETKEARRGASKKQLEAHVKKKTGKTWAQEVMENKKKKKTEEKKKPKKQRDLPKTTRGKVVGRTLRRDKGKGPGIIAKMVHILEKAGPRSAVSKELMLEKLVKAFPGRRKESMKCTVGQQLPHKMKASGHKVMRNEFGFWIPSK